MTRTATVRRTLFSIAAREATFAQRGFVRGDSVIVSHLERIGQLFLLGYNAAIARGTPIGFADELRRVPRTHTGFVVEGAAMAFALLDRLLLPRRRRVMRFLYGDASKHPYMTHVGIGWALARLGLARFEVTRRRALIGMDPLLRWLAIDGYGFHEGYFHRRRVVDRGWRPAPDSSYVARAFDQGLGRSLWFSECADPLRIAGTIARFDDSRHGDLWAGVGLACAYAGGVSDPVIAELARLGEPYARQLAQGVAFAAKTRLRAGNLVEHTTRACRVLCGMEPDQAAALTDECLAGLTSGTPRVPAFELWRRRIAARFAVRSSAPLSTT